MITSEKGKSGFRHIIALPKTTINRIMFVIVLYDNMAKHSIWDFMETLSRTLSMQYGQKLHI